MTSTPWQHGSTCADPGTSKDTTSTLRLSWWRKSSPNVASSRHLIIAVVSFLLICAALLTTDAEPAIVAIPNPIIDVQSAGSTLLDTLAQVTYPGTEDWSPSPAAIFSEPATEGVEAPAFSSRPSSPPPVAYLDPLPKWVLTSRSADLWSRSGSQGTKELSVPSRFYLRVLGQAEDGRLPVYYEDPKGSKKLGAWIDLADVWSPYDRARIVASSRGGPRPTQDVSTREKFIAVVAQAAQDSERDTQVPASVTIAQAILESDWGRSLLSKKANNFFGVKATKGSGPAGVLSMPTWEVFGGQNTNVNAAFKAYNNLWESVMDHGRFLLDNPRYLAAFKAVADPKEFARRIHAAGYATDPAYASKLITLMDKFNLYQYDLP